jgi:outer membrane receptor protein involved in Fe transport
MLSRSFWLLSVGSTALILSLLSLNTYATPLQETELDKVVVTSTKEARSINELAESISVLTQNDILNVSPSHPSEILNRTAGVYINNLGGEGHMTAIRQPITTSGVYLFLEDGVPTRPTGFFNHNGLYEVNIPQSKRLEVTKGPGSALYGSDAIGGVINSISAGIPDQAKANVDTEFGSNGWQRILVSAGAPTTSNSGMSLSVNHTENDSFRDDADYVRTSVNSRFNYEWANGLTSKTTLSLTDVEQSGVSGLEYDDFKNNIERNEYAGDVGSRDILALRIASEFNYQPNSDSLLSVTPFYRKNQSNMMPSWMVTYDANDRETEFESFGLLTKYRYNLSTNSQLITGIDIDHTPSTYTEYDVTVEKNADDIYTSFTRTGDLNYQFEADQTSISPYIQYEHKIASNIILNTGLRYDRFTVKYQDNLNTAIDSSHLRPDSQTIEYEHLSPKLGVVVALNDLHNIYSNYRHAFRAPSVSTLFRSGTSAETTNLKPVKTDSIEMGFRGLTPINISYDLAIYYMEKSDDIVTAITSDTGRTSLNAGETKHKGIELGLQGALSTDFSFHSSLSYSEQTYGEFSYVYYCYSCNPQDQEINFNGNTVGKAPETLGNIALRYEPVSIEGFMAELELEHVGEYFVDETNTSTYEGHDLLNLRSRYTINSTLEVYGRIQNITDKRYSTYTSNQVGKDDIQYRPGQPLSLFAGIRVSL